MRLIIFLVSFRFTSSNEALFIIFYTLGIVNTIYGFMIYKI